MDDGWKYLAGVGVDVHAVLTPEQGWLGGEGLAREPTVSSAGEGEAGEVSLPHHDPVVGHVHVACHTEFHVPRVRL